MEEKRPVLRRSMLIRFAKNLVLQSERSDLLQDLFRENPFMRHVPKAFAGVVLLLSSLPQRSTHFLRTRVFGNSDFSWVLAMMSFRLFSTPLEVLLRLMGSPLQSASVYASRCSVSSAFRIMTSSFQLPNRYLPSRLSRRRSACPGVASDLLTSWTANAMSGQ